MVATSVGHYEAFDLYRHSTSLGIHPESCIGFASNVLQIAYEKGRDASAPSATAKNVDQFIASVADSLIHYTR